MVTCHPAARGERWLHAWLSETALDCFTRIVILGTNTKLPTDYVAVAAFKPQLQRLLKSALRHWWAAKVLSYPLMSFIFFILIFAVVLLPLPVVWGQTAYAGHGLYRVYDALYRTNSGQLVLTAFLLVAAPAPSSGWSFS